MGGLCVFVVEGHPLMRAGLERTVEREADFELIGSTATNREAIAQLAGLRPDVVLIDAYGGGPGRRQLVELATARGDSVAVLFTVSGTLGGAGRPGVASELEDLMEAGAAGVVGKAGGPRRLVDAIKAVAGGTRVVAIDMAEDAAHAPGRVAFGERDRAILALIAAGHTNAEIGKRSFVSTKTVERYVAAITTKLGARNRAHAAALAVAAQLVEPPAGSASDAA